MDDQETTCLADLYDVQKWSRPNECGSNVRRPE